MGKKAKLLFCIVNLFVSYFQEVDSVIFCVGMAKVGVEVNFVFSVSDHCWKPKKSF